MLGSCRLQRRDAKEASLNGGGFAPRDSGNGPKCLRAASREKSSIAHRSLNFVRSHFRSPLCPSGGDTVRYRTPIGKLSVVGPSQTRGRVFAMGGLLPPTNTSP